MSVSPQSHKEHQESQREFVQESHLEKENALSKHIVDCAFKVHKTVGPGLLESAYEECLEKELLKRKIAYDKQCTLPIYYDGDRLKTPYRIDFLIEGRVIIEIKAVEKILPVHEAQLLTYLKLSNKKLGLLINFCSPLIKNGIKRFVI